MPNPEQQPKQTPEQREESKYNKVMDELKQLDDTDKTNDKVEIANAKLNEAFRDYLAGNPTNLKELRDKVKEIDADSAKKGAAGKGFDRIKDFLDKLDNKVEKCYNDFMEILAKNPDKLSKIKDDDINMICTYLQSNPTKALKDYPTIKGAWNGNKNEVKDTNVMKKVWETLKQNYGNNDKFIKEDFKDIYEETTALKDRLTTYATEGWNGEDSGFIRGLNGKFDGNKTIVNENTVIQELKRLNGVRINNIKDKSLAPCKASFDEIKTKFKKKNGELKYNNNGNRKEFTQGMISTNFGDSLKGDIAEAGGQDIVTDGTDASRVLSMLEEELYNYVVSIAPEVKQAAPVAPEAPAGGVKEIPNDKWEMTDPDFNAMEENLGKDMFITYNEGTKTYSYNSELLTKYLQKSQNDATKNDFKLNASNGAGMVWKRRAWISAVQLFLNKNHESNLKVDGKLGWDSGQHKPTGETYEAVKDFQTKYNNDHPDANPKLVADGIPGPSTIKALLESATTTQ